MVTYNQRTFWHWVYWMIGIFVALASLIGFILIYLTDGTLFVNINNTSHSFYSVKFMMKTCAFGVLVPVFMYPAQLCNNANWFSVKAMATDFGIFWLMIGLCTYGVMLVTLTEIAFLVYFSIEDKIYTNYGWFACELFCILYQLFLIIYRLFGKSAVDFWQATFGDISSRPKQPVPEYYTYRERLYPDKWNKNCFWKMVVILYYLIVNPLWILTKWFSVIAFLIIVACGLIVGTLYFVFKVVIMGTFGFCCCNEKRRKFFLDFKRYSYIYDYVQFHILLYRFNGGKFYVYFAQYAPFKYYVSTFLMYFFQQRYLTRSLGGGNTLPNYDLLTPDHCSYFVLTDNGRTTYTRWLPPNPPSNLPPAELVANKLFLRQTFIPETHINLSVLSAFYIRFFTHQFTNTAPDEWNHLNEPIGINLMQIYGSNRQCEGLMRNEYEDRHLLKGTVVNGKEFPFIKTDSKDNQRYFETPETSVNNDKIFSKTSPDYYMFYILFFRHHQYVARSLKNAYPELTEDTIFDMTRMINILTIIKCTLALYGDIGVVQSTEPSRFQVYDFENLLKWWVFKVFGAGNQLFPSNATTIPIEFNLLYRWHQLIPDTIPIVEYDEKDDEQTNLLDIQYDHHDSDEMRELKLPYPNAVDFLTEPNGLETMLLSCSKSPTGKITLFNTEKLLTRMVTLATIKKGRYYQLASFNEYRKAFGFKPYGSIDEINDDPKITAALKQVYDNDVDKVEFYVGLWAEEKLGDALHGPFVTATFASTVITLLTSTPLLRKKWDTILTPLGKQIVDDFMDLSDLVELHTKLKGADVKKRIVSAD